MREARCTVTDLIESQCAHCRPAPARDALSDFLTQPSQLGPWFFASYPGACTECGCKFDAGDMIRAAVDSGYIADCCDQTP